MKHVSIFHRRTSVFLAEQLKEKAGILISDGKADIIVESAVLLNNFAA